MVWQALIAPITGLLDKIIPDADERNRLAFEINSLAERQHHALMQGQLDVNKVQAAHKSMFVAGARPGTMWICNLGLLYSVIVHPILSIWYELPPINTEILMPVMMGMLGLGGMRSFEKSKGVARER